MQEEEIEILIDRELLEKVQEIANKQGLSAEEYISYIVNQYVEKNIF